MLASLILPSLWPLILFDSPGEIRPLVNLLLISDRPSIDVDRTIGTIVERDPFLGTFIPLGIHHCRLQYDRPGHGRQITAAKLCRNNHRIQSGIDDRDALGYCRHIVVLVTLDQVVVEQGILGIKSFAKPDSGPVLQFTDGDLVGGVKLDVGPSALIPEYLIVLKNGKSQYIERVGVDRRFMLKAEHLKKSRRYPGSVIVAQINMTIQITVDWTGEHTEPVISVV